MTRVLTLTSPHMKGDDVRRLQRAAGVRPVDGDYGPQTHAVVLAKARRLGVSPVAGSTKAARRRVAVILGAFRTPAERLRARKLKKAAAVASHGLAAARRFALAQVGTKEQPAGTNSGPKIDRWQRSVGIARAPWCGAFAWAVADAYGVKLTTDVRYCPSIRGHAQAGTGGFERWTTDWSTAQRAIEDGRLVLPVYDFGGSIAEHVGGIALGVTATATEDVEGNTSAGPGGSQDNGGMVAHRTRNNSLIQGWAIVRKPVAA
jgi:peptidoglycan hydrolase-like protein with peptidoglycan-binding domain